jgi:hypothetical protein
VSRLGLTQKTVFALPVRDVNHDRGHHDERKRLRLGADQ